MKKGSILFAILCYLILVCNPVSGTTLPYIYSEDFSTDPGFYTDQADNYDWDEIGQQYYFKVENKAPDYQPNDLMFLGGSRFGMDGGGGYCEGYIDNVNLVPEPATILLVGLGGLALLRKRRG